jgi:opacity protein-like surface antigen
MLLAIVIAQDAFAMRYQPHPNWMVAVAWGLGRGSFSAGSMGIGGAEYRNGAAPQIRFGRKFAEHWMVNIYYDAWLIEFDADDPDTGSTERVKWRRTLQDFGVGFTVYPGNLNGASGGIYLRAGAGLGWAGTARVDIIAEEAQGSGDRIDEWGTGFSVGGGYDFWISSNFQAGIGLTYNYFDIGEAIVDTAWFTAGTLNLNLFF